MHQFAEHLAFYGRVLHIIVQTAEMRVPSFLFGGFPGNLVGVLQSIYLGACLALLVYMAMAKGSHIPSHSPSFSFRQLILLWLVK